MYRVRWSTTVGLRWPCVIGSEWHWPVVGAFDSSISQCDCASPGGWTADQCGGGGGSNALVVPELGVAPLEDSGTDLEDELPTPDGSPSSDAVQPEVGPAPRGVDLELARALLELGVLPQMVMPIVDQWRGARIWIIPDSGSEPIPSGISPSFRTDDISGRPSGMAPMDQYLARDASLLSGSQRTSLTYRPL